MLKTKTYKKGKNIMKNNQSKFCWSNYTSIDQIIKEQDKNKHIEAIKNILVGFNLAIFGVITIITLMGL